MERVTLEWFYRHHKRSLQFNFDGHLDDFSAKTVIAKWKNEIAEKVDENEKVDVIYNCLNMTGFDTSARKAWQNAMLDLKPKLNEVWIISDNSFILAAAKTMGLLTRFKIKVTRSLETVA